MYAVARRKIDHPESLQTRWNRIKPDYLSRVNDLPVCAEYSDIRKTTLQKPISPASIVALSAVSKTR
jgi:hypothetical protein